MQPLDRETEKIGWVQSYFLGRKSSDFDAEEFCLTAEDARNAALFITGPELIQYVYSAIELRQQVLLIGPRGSGKSFCAEEAIRKARENGVIGGWYYIQGNREIPRELLSEPQLVIVNEAPKTLDPLLFRRKVKIPKELPAELREKWPGVSGQDIRPSFDPRKLWKPEHWSVLYLDELTRFGDGFLDSLLSLLEQGSIVCRGEEIYVPVSVVATANPPGYDSTSKRLTPPLQARITRAFRISQAPLDVLAERIIPSKLNKLVNIKVNIT